MTTKLVIVGGVAGGATAAARARRLDEQAQIVVFERDEYISFANCGLPYYIGRVIKRRDHLLVTTPKELHRRYNIDVRVFCEVTRIDPARKQIDVRNVQTGETYVENYDKLILSPGAEPITPPIEGIDLPGIFNLRNIPDTDRIKAHVDTRKPEAAVVVGGGFIGLEMAENLVLRGVKTTIVEMLDQVMPPIDHEMATFVHDHLRAKGVDLELKNGVRAFAEAGGRLVVHTQNGRELTCDLAILSVGVRPEHQLARAAGLAISPRGGIAVDAAMRTSDPDIFAVGDAVTVTDLVTGHATMTALAGPANKQGRIAADNALGRKAEFKGTLGTSVVQVFDLTVASTGAAEKSLRRDNIAFQASYSHSGSHAGYYPGAGMMVIKLLFTPDTGRVLGAQIIGPKGVDKRIDVIATAIKGGMTVYDLEELELAYAPPYSSAKDPVNIAGFVAANLLKGDHDIIHWHELPHIDPATDVLLDVREQKEIEKLGAINGALHIPLWKLRHALPGLDKSKNYVAYCAVGLRGYLAHRILSQHGFKSRNLSGGYRLYQSVKGQQA